MAGSPPYYDNIRWGGPKGVRIPQEAFPGTMALVKETDINVGGAGTTNTINLSLDQTRSSYYTITNPGSGATTIKWPAVLPGLVFTVFNNTAQSSVWMVLGKTGITVATTKKAMLVMDEAAGDILRLTADI
jgi:hypothetical protein